MININSHESEISKQVWQILILMKAKLWHGWFWEKILKCWKKQNSYERECNSQDGDYQDGDLKICEVPGFACLPMAISPSCIFW